MKFPPGTDPQKIAADLQRAVEELGQFGNSQPL
jgi:hypothetical protein